MRTFAFGVFVTLACTLGACAIGSGAEGEATGIARTGSGGSAEPAESESSGGAEQTGVAPQALTGFRVTEGAGANAPNGDWGEGPSPIPWQPDNSRDSTTNSKPGRTLK
jgi:hypothetical protein